MSCETHINIIDKDIDNCLYEVECCDNILSCSCCCYFLDRHKNNVIDELISKIGNIPDKITRIKVPLYPLPANLPYFEFDGLSTICFNLLKSNNIKHIKAVEKHTAFLKIFYERNSLFNLPLIQIEVIFLGELHPKSRDEFWKTLKAEVLFFTGSVGDIDVIDIRGYNDLFEIFEMPLLVGYPEFKNEGVLLENRISPEQIKQMNYLHSFHLMELDLKKEINNNQIELFDLQKTAIKSETNRQNNHELDPEDLIRAIFNGTSEMPNQKSNSSDDDTMDNLPF